LDISTRVAPGVTIGSLAGESLVLLGANTLTIGSNNQSTTFSGVVQGTGGLTKAGTGTLTLTGANTYAGVTTVNAGVLRAANKTGSATSTGAVNVNAGTLGGKGTIVGPTTIGTGSGAGAFLAPSVGSKQANNAKASTPPDLQIRWHLHLQPGHEDGSSLPGASEWSDDRKRSAIQLQRRIEQEIAARRGLHCDQ